MLDCFWDRVCGGGRTARRSLSRLAACVTVGAAAVAGFSDQAMAVNNASTVLSFDAGAGTAGLWTDPNNATGQPDDLTGETGIPFGAFPNVLSIVSPAYEADELVQIGEGGHITLQFASTVYEVAGAAEIGVIENVGFIATSTINGSFGADSALVEVSADNSTWVSLGTQLFDMPASYFVDAGGFDTTPGSVESDRGLPYAGSGTDFTGLTYAQAIAQLGGSIGGTWLDISGTGLSEVNYIRFSVEDDGDDLTSLSLELDAVLASTASETDPNTGGGTGGGGPGNGVVPEPASASLLTLAIGAVTLRRRRIA